MPQNAFFMRQGDAEATQAEIRRGFQKVTEVLDQKRQIYGVDAASDEGGVVQKRRKRVRNRVADHAKHARFPVELMSAIEMLHFAQRDLSGSSGCFERGVRKLATFAQREQAGRKADFAHGN